MQLQSENRPDEVKTQFRAREGHYRLMNSPDYSQRSQKALGIGNNSGPSSGPEGDRCEKTSIKISLVTINDSTDPIAGIRQRSPDDQHHSPGITPERSFRNPLDRKICFNVGLELFVYDYDGIKNGPDAGGSIFRKSYKSNAPTCHDFNQATATSSSICLLVGFSQGQVQLIDLTGDGCEKEENFKEFNVDRLIDKTRVTCIKWLPNSHSLFLVAHASGRLYLYKSDLSCGPVAPTYQIYKQSGGVAIYTCKTKTTRNPIYKWTIGGQSQDQGSSSSLLGSSVSLHSIENECYSLNEFAFSPCAKYMACASQDGFLRVFCYDTMELVGRARSYYGGLTCVCWSPDGRYVVTGGEDDLITIWSFVERRVVARGMGHKSWISVVTFDKFYTGQDVRDDFVDNDDDDDEDEDDDDVDGFDEGFSYVEDDGEDDIDTRPFRASRNRVNRMSRSGNPNEESGSPSKGTANHKNYLTSPTNNRVISIDGSASHCGNTSYRFGSVGHDTQLCLWDLSDDLLKQSSTKSRINSLNSALPSHNPDGVSTSSIQIENDSANASAVNGSADTNGLDPARDTELERSNGTKALALSSSGGFLSLRSSGFSKTFSLMSKRDRRNLSQRNSKGQKSQNGHNGYLPRLTEDPMKLLGSAICPRINEVPVIQPSVCKKISYERLTSLTFLRGGFITSCQEGYVSSWARPSRVS